jgi:hypothetical protein
MVAMNMAGCANISGVMSPFIDALLTAGGVAPPSVV